MKGREASHEPDGNEAVDHDACGNRSSSECLESRAGLTVGCIVVMVEGKQVEDRHDHTKHAVDGRGGDEGEKVGVVSLHEGRHTGRQVGRQISG